MITLKVHSKYWSEFPNLIPSPNSKADVILKATPITTPTKTEASNVRYQTTDVKLRTTDIKHCTSWPPYPNDDHLYAGATVPALRRPGEKYHVMYAMT